MESPRAEAVEHRKLLIYANYFRKGDQAVPEMAEHFVDRRLSHCDIVLVLGFHPVLDASVSDPSFGSERL